MKNNIRFSGTMLGMLTLALVLAFPSGASAAARRQQPVSINGNAGANIQGGQRNFDFSVNSTSDSCGMSRGQVVGCQGSGQMTYTDYMNNTYVVDARYVSGNGRNVYFAGPVISSSNPGQVGNWLYANVNDRQGPGAAGRDQVSGVFTNEDIARQRVANQGRTGIRPYSVNSGNVNVGYSQRANMHDPSMAPMNWR
ncbi:MAG: hypothetical protein JWO73_384 [Candidatus Taylorbacteria bacterium]|nr:hypothetical protein [Candidatus Taylorbacteria bacterium]